MEWIREKRPINKVYPDEKNPRRISKLQAQGLKTSLQKFGQCEPIVLNVSGKVLGGHQRLKLMRSLGYSHIDVYFPTEPLTTEEERELSIRLNKNIGYFDDDLLANNWECKELLKLGFGMAEMQLEAVPNQKKPPNKFKFIISCTDAIQLELIEKYIAPLIEEHIGASYRVRIT